MNCWKTKIIVISLDFLALNTNLQKRQDLS